VKSRSADRDESPYVINSKEGSGTGGFSRGTTLGVWEEVVVMVLSECSANIVVRRATKMGSQNKGFSF
jgi:hypothetical protein